MLLDYSAAVLTALISLIAFLTIFLTVLLVWLKKKPTGIICRDPLFNQESHSFLGLLDIAVRSHLSIFPSLPVGDILQAKPFSKGAIALSRVKQQRFDYVLYHRREMKVLCAIKLLPYGHKGDNKELKSLRAACAAAELTLLEYEAKPYRDVVELRKVVFSACGIDELGIKEQELVKTREIHVHSIDARRPEITEEPPVCSRSPAL